MYSQVIVHLPVNLVDIPIDDTVSHSKRNYFWIIACYKIIPLDGVMVLTSLKKVKKVSGTCRLEDNWNKVINRKEKMNQGSSGGGNRGIIQFQKFKIEESQRQLK